MANEPRSGSDSGQIVAVAQKEDLIGLFNVIAGRQNSLSQIFSRRIIVSQPEIEDLYKKIREKLKRYTVPAGEFNVTVSFENEQTLELASWNDFVSHDWKIPTQTETIILRWEFLIQFARQEKPTHHTITVRMADTLSPFHFMRMIFSRDPRDVDLHELNPRSPVLCRVDFADKVLSQEILNIVKEWNRACRCPQPIFKWIEFAGKHGEKIRGFIRQSIPIFGALVYVVAFYRYHFLTAIEIPATAYFTYQLAYWFFGFYFLVKMLTVTALWLGDIAYNNLEALSRFSVFELTNGDRNRQNELAAKNARSAWRFLGAFGSTVLIHIIAGLITASLLHGMTLH